MRLPSNVSATETARLLPTLTSNLSEVSFHCNNASSASPLSIVIPPFCVGVPVWLELRTMLLSATSSVSVLTVVVVPFTVKSPPITTSRESVASLAVMSPVSVKSVAFTSVAFTVVLLIVVISPVPIVAVPVILASVVLTSVAFTVVPLSVVYVAVVPSRVPIEPVSASTSPVAIISVVLTVVAFTVVISPVVIVAVSVTLKFTEFRSSAVTSFVTDTLFAVTLAAVVISPWIENVFGTSFVLPAPPTLIAPTLL